MPRPVIENIYRRPIPLGGLVVIQGRHLREVDRVCARVDRFQNIEPASGMLGEGGGFGMFPGYDITPWVLYPEGNYLEFQLPNDQKYLTSWSVGESDVGLVHTFGGLVVTVHNQDGWSNEFPSAAELRGLTTMDPTTLEDPPNVHSVPEQDLERLLCEMINELRDRHHVRRVNLNSSLSDIARDHSDKMNDAWCFDGLPGCNGTIGWLGGGTDAHRAPDEDAPSVRVGQAGFNYGLETCAMNWGYRAPIKKAVEDWDNSCGHRAIMLHPDQREVGIGIVRNFRTAGYYYTFTADYAR